MSIIQFRCQHCGVKLETEESDIGKQALCPACGKKLRIELQTNYEPEDCGWAVFLYCLATLELFSGITILLLAAVDYSLIFAILGGSVMYSSIFTFMGGWFAQQVYLSNELQKRQITLLAKIENKLEE